MEPEESPLASWTPEQIALGRRWVATWERAGKHLEEIELRELRELDVYRAIETLCGPADYTVEPYAPVPWSGLIEQQRWFKKFARRE